MTDRERIDSLVKKTSDYADEIMELNQENNELKKRVAELENSAKDTNVRSKKRRHKLRVMTYGEFCEKWYKQYNCCAYLINETPKNVCPFNGLSKYSSCCDYNELYTYEPCKLPNGKYILIEVKE